MTHIDPDAVIDAIARNFPDGFEYSPLDRAEWPAWLADALYEANAENCYSGNEVRECVAALLSDGRLREMDVFDDGHVVVALSWSEQAHRVCALLSRALVVKIAPSLVEVVANVLAGKTEKRT